MRTHPFDREMGLAGVGGAKHSAHSTPVGKVILILDGRAGDHVLLLSGALQTGNPKMKPPANASTTALGKYAEHLIAQMTRLIVS